MDINNDEKNKLTRYLHFLEYDPKNFNLLISISDSYRLLGDFTSAQQYLDKAKEINNEACFAQQGVIDLNLGHFHEAKVALQKALLKEDLSILRFALAVCHYSLHENSQGIEQISLLIEQGHSTFDVDLLFAKLLHQDNRPEEAIKAIETTIDKYGPEGESLALLAQLYFEIEQLKLAENAAQQALIVAPDNYEAEVILLMLKLNKGEVSVNKIKKLLAKNAEDARLWFALGTTHLQSLKLQRAEESFLKATTLDPLFHDNWISLGWCQLFLDKPDDAQRSYQQAVTIYEESSEAWGGLALVAALGDNFNETQNLIAKAKKLDSQCFLAEIAQIIYANQIEPQDAAVQFNQTFPKTAKQLNAAMSIVLANLENPNSIIH